MIYAYRYILSKGRQPLLATLQVCMRIGEPQPATDTRNPRWPPGLPSARCFDMLYGFRFFIRWQTSSCCASRCSAKRRPQLPHGTSVTCTCEAGDGCMAAADHIPGCPPPDPVRLPPPGSRAQTLGSRFRGPDFFWCFLSQTEGIPTRPDNPPAVVGGRSGTDSSPPGHQP